MRPGRGFLGPPACTYEHIGASNRLAVRVRVDVPTDSPSGGSSASRSSATLPHRKQREVTVLAGAA